MKKDSITIVITVWKRDYLDQQLESLTTQTVPPDHIWIVQNEHHVNIEPVVEKFRESFLHIEVIHSGFNLKYFGRFSICCHAETEYVLVIDDDVIPSANWLQICLEKSKKYNAVISCTGRIIPPLSFRPEECDDEGKKQYFIGDTYNDGESNYFPRDTQVDYGCNSYFFRKEWMKYFWSIWPATFLSGEDIHLSASLMVTKRIPTVVPQQTCSTTTGNLKRHFSLDSFSSWRNPGFIDIRESVFAFFIKEKEWKPLLWQ
jgi:GT2 family glycosyltransferase